MVCRSRAYYAARPEVYKPRRILDMEDSRERGRIFVEELLIPTLRELAAESSLNRVVKEYDGAGKEYCLTFKGRGLDVVFICRPDAVIITSLHGKLLRVLVLEVADTDTTIVLKEKHVIPRILVYMMSTHLHYGVPSAGFYVSLSPSSSYPALLFTFKGGVSRKLVKLMEEVATLTSLNKAPRPAGKPPCSHCVYARKCEFAA